MSGKIARKFLVRGEVQGVGYRFFAQRAAAQHQVVGYVRNLPDGSVESLVEGPAQSVEGYRNDLATGPRFSVVEQVKKFLWSQQGFIRCSEWKGKSWVFELWS